LTRSRFISRLGPRAWLVLGLLVVALAAGVGAYAATGGFTTSDGGVAAIESDVQEGSDSDADDSATGGASEPTDQEQAMLDFAQCIRDNGVPNFPDPKANADGTFSFQRPTGRVDQAAVERAQQTCQPLLEGTGLGIAPDQDQSELEDALLEFAECMRANGVDMPDPDLSGGGNPFQGVDPNSPNFQAAFGSCQSVLAPLMMGGGMG
jgi:hypothetical protein